MDALIIAELKDKILSYLSESTNKVIVKTILDNLKPENLSIDVFNDYLDDMVNDRVIDHEQIAGEIHIYSITNNGNRKLREGGYKKQLEREIEKANQLLEDSQKYRDKINLEISNLTASLKHYKLYKRLSIWAIVISIISIAISILLKN